MSTTTRTRPRRGAALLAGSVGVGVATLLLVGCSSGGDDDTSGAAAADPGAAPAAVDVVIDTFQYGPDPVTVPAGTTVRFTNEDPTTHTVTAGTRQQPNPGAFDASLSEGDSVPWTLTESGTYDYYCTIHKGEGMTGQVVVQ